MSEASRSTSQLPSGLYELEDQLRIAVKMEDYKRAAQLRDLARESRSRDSLAAALDELDTAVASQDFESAATARDRIAAAVASRSSRPSSVRVNRLLVTTKEGALFTCAPDGTAVSMLSDPSEIGSVVNLQVTEALRLRNILT